MPPRGEHFMCDKHLHTCILHAGLRDLANLPVSSGWLELCQEVLVVHEHDLQEKDSAHSCERTFCFPLSFLFAATAFKG